MIKIIVTVFLLFSIIVCFASENDTIYQGRLGLLVGTDIGGAVPFPPKNIPGKINAYPQINANIGAKFSFSLIKQWGLGAELNYKTIEMEADARVTNQKFQMDDDVNMYFTGTTTMDMKFTMLEVPLYAKYHFKDKKNIVFAGFYYSYIFSGKFVADPQKGFSGPVPDMAEITDMSTIKMEFTSFLTNWDWGYLLGYERRIFDRFALTLRFSMGLKDIFKSSSNYFDYSMLHMRGSITVSYDLFKTKSLFGNKRSSHIANQPI
ncbi:MAG: PorT family protein [Bacteroidales bacterium]|jgi:hypothetical protein|nr:PorT family protein [Bacteroidales bacterium]